MVVELGGGRRAVGDRVDPRVGFVLRVAVGDPVAAGDVLGEVHAGDPAGAARGCAALRKAVAIGDGPADVRPLVSHRVDSRGVQQL